MHITVQLTLDRRLRVWVSPSMPGWYRDRGGSQRGSASMGTRVQSGVERYSQYTTLPAWKGIEWDVVTRIP